MTYSVIILPRAQRDFQRLYDYIRQLLFKTSQGLTYRALFVIRDDQVLLIHLRGPGQDIMDPQEVRLPD